MFVPGEWVDNMGVPCCIVLIDKSSLRVVLCGIDGAIHYQDKNSLQLTTLPEYLNNDLLFHSKIKRRCKIIRQNYFGHPKIKMRMKARRLIKKELKRIRRKYNSIIAEINAMLKNESINTGKSIIYDCVEIGTAQDILFYYSHRGFIARNFTEIEEKIAVVQISWNIKK